MPPARISLSINSSESTAFPHLEAEHLESDYHFMKEGGSNQEGIEGDKVQPNYIAHSTFGCFRVECTNIMVTANRVT